MFIDHWIRYIEITIGIITLQLVQHGSGSSLCGIAIYSRTMLRCTNRTHIKAYFAISLRNLTAHYSIVDILIHKSLWPYSSANTVSLCYFFWLHFPLNFCHMTLSKSSVLIRSQWRPVAPVLGDMLYIIRWKSLETPQLACLWLMSVQGHGRQLRSRSNCSLISHCIAISASHLCHLCSSRLNYTRESCCWAGTSVLTYHFSFRDWL